MILVDCCMKLMDHLRLMMTTMKNKYLLMVTVVVYDVLMEIDWVVVTLVQLEDDPMMMADLNSVDEVFL